MRKHLRYTLATLLVLAWSAAAMAASLPEFTDLAAKAGDAVVNINTVKLVKQSDQMREFFKFRQRGTPFDKFFDQFDELFKNRPDAKPRKERSLGSGFIISKDGYVVTNNHVIEGADEIKVKLQDTDESLDAEIVGRDPETDLALLKISADRDFPTLSFGDSDKAKVGQWVMAIGNPFGLDHSVTAGIISAKGRIIGSGPFDDFIQTDASINPGNSGGPLLNMDGEVIGINTAIIASGQGIGFAVPSSMAKRVIAQLQEHKKVSRGWLGVTIQGVDENTAKALGLDKAYGALIASVIPDEPADKAGVKPGDVIIKIDGQEVKDSNDLLRRIAAYTPGSKLRFTVWRNGSSKRLTATLGERDTERLAKSGKAPGGPQQQDSDSFLGMTVRPVNEEEAAALGLDKAQGLLVVEVDANTPAQESEIRPGDVILQANQRPVSSVGDLEKIIKGDAKDKGVLLLLIQRQGQTVFRTVPLPGE
ncbi:DegQ family serine endoprotease [Desulfocurvus sp. DL9XJH121]